jgi:hypothetical protein
MAPQDPEATQRSEPATQRSQPLAYSEATTQGARYYGEVAGDLPYYSDAYVDAPPLPEPPPTPWYRRPAVLVALGALTALVIAGLVVLMVKLASGSSTPTSTTSPTTPSVSTTTPPGSASTAPAAPRQAPQTVTQTVAPPATDTGTTSTQTVTSVAPPTDTSTVTQTQTVTVPPSGGLRPPFYFPRPGG